ncbi:hypothetical protein [Dysgonomonas mossii]|uniref:hypothetical protein n=1 Tax=Dysgonomonas mossii TaxID=163665 RepID=UPI0039A2E4E8
MRSANFTPSNSYGYFQAGPSTDRTSNLHALKAKKQSLLRLISGTLMPINQRQVAISVMTEEEIKQPLSNQT